MIARYFILLLLVCAHIAAAQEKVADIVTPASPASSVIGLQATEILAPKSAKALETALFSNFTNNNAFTIPNDFALEFTPYWASDHGLSGAEYLSPSYNEQLIRNSSFSIASTQKFALGNGAMTNSLGLGYRTSIFFGSKPDRSRLTAFLEADSRFNTLRAHVASQLEASMAGTRDAMLEEAESLIIREIRTIYGLADKEARAITRRIISTMKRETFESTNTQPFLDILYHEIALQAPGWNVLSEFKEYLKKREGLRIDAAFATMINFPTNEFDYSFAPRTSLWITPEWRISKEIDFLKLLGVLRRDWYDIDYYDKFFPGQDYYKQNTDYGLGVALEFRRFSFQGEAVWRHSYSEVFVRTEPDGRQLFAKEEHNSFQYVGTFSYNFSDQVILTYNLGSKFNFAQTGNALFSLLSLNLGFGDPGQDIQD